MITPREFKESFLKNDDKRFALWFQHTVENAPELPLFSRSKQCFSIPATDVPQPFLELDGRLKKRAKEIVFDFGWGIIYTNIVEDNDKSGTKITFRWTDEKLDTSENIKKYEKQYKYLAFNSTMWDYGHTDMSEFDKWFNKVAAEHRSSLSYNELVYESLIIPYDEIKKANASFVEDYTYKYKEHQYYETYASYSNKELETSTLRKPYVKHLEHLGWEVMDGYFDDKYCLVCR